MTYKIKNVYEYHRTKTLTIENEREIIFLCAGITIERVKHLGQTTQLHLEVITSKIKRISITEASQELMNLKDETVTYNISLKECNILIDWFEKDLELIYLFNSKQESLDEQKSPQGSKDNNIISFYPKKLRLK